MTTGGMPATAHMSRLEAEVNLAFGHVWDCLLRCAPEQIKKLDDVFIRKPWPWTYAHGVAIARSAWPTAPKYAGPVDWLWRGTSMMNLALGKLWESNITDDVQQPKIIPPESRAWMITLGEILIALRSGRLPTPGNLVRSLALMGAGYGSYVPPLECALCYRLAAPYHYHHKELSKYCEEHRVSGESGRQDAARARAKRARAWIAKHYPGWMSRPLTQLDNMRMPAAIVQGRTHNLDLSELRSALEISARADNVVGHLPLDPQAALARLRDRLDHHEWSWDPTRWAQKIYRADVWLEALEATSKKNLGGSSLAWAKTHDLIKLAAQELAKGKSTTDVAEMLGKSPSTIRMWRKRHPDLFRS